MIRGVFSYVVLCLFLLKSAHAQSLEGHFSHETILAANAGSLISNALYLANNTDDSLRVHFAMAEPSIRLFNAKSITVAPHTTALQLVKCMLPRSFLYAGFPVRLWILSEKGDTTTAVFKIDMSPQRNIQMNGLDLSPVVSNPKETLHVSLLVRNKGNTSEPLSLHCNAAPNWIPEQQDFGFFLPAYTDTTLTLDYHFQKSDNGDGYGQQSLAIDLRDSNNVSVTVVNVQPVMVTNRLMLSQDNSMPVDNYASAQFYHNNRNLNTREYQLAYNKAASTNGVILSMDAYDAGSATPLTLMNTYIGYKQGAAALRAGLMNIWGELPIYGQGGNITLGDAKRFISASYLVNANAYLFGDQNAPGNDTRNLHFAGSYALTGQTSVNGMFLHQWNSPVYTDLYMGGAGFKWQPDLQQSLEASFSGSSGTLYNGQQEGGAAHLRWGMRKTHWQVFSDNYYSTPEYAGLLKKTKQFSELINYRFSEDANGWGVGVVANYLNSDPYTYGLGGMVFHNFQENDQYGVNVFKTIGSSSFRLMPYYSFQQTQFANGPMYELKGFYTTVDWTYNGRQSSVCGSLTTALDYSQNQMPARNGNSIPIRLQMQARYKYFYFQGLVQNHAFFASDLIQEVSFGKPFSMYSVGPGLRVPLFHQKLELCANYNLQYFASSPLPYQYLYGSMVASLFNNWQLTGACSYTFTNGITYSDIRLGIRFLFHRPADFFKQKRTMIFFNDVNQNGRRDGDEALLQGVVYGSNHQMAQSDAGGRIKMQRYSDQAGNDLGIINGNGYLPVKQIKDLPFKKSKKYVPMYKLGTISGKISLVVPKYYTRTVSITGLPLVFTNEYGQSFTCYVMADSSFHISLPAGKYEIKISSDLSDLYQLPKKEHVTVTPQQTESVKLEVKFKSAQMVDILRFTGKK